MLPPSGLGLRRAKELAAVPALVTGHGLVVVLRPPGAVLPIKAAKWVRMVRADQIRTHRTRVLHGWEGIKSPSFIKSLVMIGKQPIQRKGTGYLHQPQSSPGMFAGYFTDAAPLTIEQVAA